MSQPKTDTRGTATVARYGAAYVAARAREGKVRRALEADHLDPAKMKPEDYEAYRRQVFARSAAMARAAKAMKAAVRQAEREAERAAAKAAQKRQELADAEAEAYFAAARAANEREDHATREEGAA